MEGSFNYKQTRCLCNDHGINLYWDFPVNGKLEELPAKRETLETNRAAELSDGKIESRGDGWKGSP